MKGDFEGMNGKEGKVLVTGGAGFIGTHVVSESISQGLEVVVVDDLSSGSSKNVPSQAKLYICDITQPSLIKIVEHERPIYVIHLAAQSRVQLSLDDPFYDASVNVLGTINLLEACRRSLVKHVVYASSAAVYGQPRYLGVDESHPLQADSPYGLSKGLSEHYLDLYSRCYAIDYVILRLANVYGPRQDAANGEGSVISSFAKALLRDEPIQVYGDGLQTRDFIYVKDAAEAIVSSLGMGINDALNISTATETSVLDLLELLQISHGRRGNPVFLPPRVGDIKRSYLSNSRAKALLGWEPKIMLREGIDLTLDYYRSSAGLSIETHKEGSIV